MIRLLLLFILMLIGICCSTDSGQSVLSDFKTIPIELENSAIESYELGELLDMVVFDSILIINEVFKEKIFKYFLVENGKMVYNFTTRGKGPNEIIFPGLITVFNDSVFSTYDSNKKQLICLKIQHVIDGNFQFNKALNIDLQDLTVFQGYPVNDSLIIFTGIFEAGQYCLYNTHSGKTIVDVDFPDNIDHKGESNYIKAMAYQGEIAIKPDKSKFVFVCRNGYFDVCSVSGKGIFLEKRNLYYLSEYMAISNTSVAHSSQSEYAFHSVETTDDYIYMVYSGRTHHEFESEYVAGNNILVYDWHGNPVVNFKTNRYLHRMTLDRNNLIVYGYSINPVTAEPEIVTCKLPNH